MSNFFLQVSLACVYFDYNMVVSQSNCQFFYCRLLQYIYGYLIMSVLPIQYKYSFELHSAPSAPHKSTEVSLSLTKVCGVSCVSAEGLRSHLYRCHSEIQARNSNLELQSFSCTIDSCADNFTSERFLISHLRSHIDEGLSTPCPVCFRTFSNKSYFSSHVSRTHRGTEMVAGNSTSFETENSNTEVPRINQEHRSSTFVGTSLPAASTSNFLIDNQFVAEVKKKHYIVFFFQTSVTLFNTSFNCR